MYDHRVYQFQQGECDHISLSELIPRKPSKSSVNSNRTPVINIISKDWCSHCFTTKHYTELLKRKFPPAPRSEDIRFRTAGIWKRLAQNPGLVDSKDWKFFRDQMTWPKDVMFLVVILQDMEEDIFHRWQHQELDQPTNEQKQLYLQLRDCIRYNIVLELDDRKDYDITNDPTLAEWQIPIHDAKTVFTPVDLNTLIDTATETNKQCGICGKDYRQQGESWHIATSDEIPVRMPCCNAVSCHECALSATVGAISDYGGRLTPACFFCRQKLPLFKESQLNYPEDSILNTTVVAQGFDRVFPSQPPWMEIFRPTE